MVGSIARNLRDSYHLFVSPEGGKRKQIRVSSALCAVSNIYFFGEPSVLIPSPPPTPAVRRRRWVRKMVRLDQSEVRKLKAKNAEGVLSQVQNGLRSLIKSLNELDSFCKMIGTSRDSFQIRQSISNYILMSTKVLGKTADLVGLIEDEGQRRKVGREVAKIEKRLVVLVQEGERKCLLHPLSDVISSSNSSGSGGGTGGNSTDTRIRNSSNSFKKQFDQQVALNNSRNDEKSEFTFEEMQIQQKLIGTNEAMIMNSIINEKGKAIQQVNESMQELAVVFKVSVQISNVMQPNVCHLLAFINTSLHHNAVQEVASLVNGQQEFIDQLEGNAEITRERTKQGLR